jgi:hypothetical protein
VNAILSRFVLLQNKDTEGYLVIAGDSAPSEVFAATVGTVLGDRHTVRGALTIAYNRPNLGVCLVGKGHSEAAIREASHGFLVTLRGG